MYGTKLLVSKFEELGLTESTSKFHTFYVFMDRFLENDVDVHKMIFRGGNNHTAGLTTGTIEEFEVGVYELEYNLIGFRAKEGIDYEGMMYNVRSLAPIIDRKKCQEAIVYPTKYALLFEQVRGFYRKTNL